MVEENIQRSYFTCSYCMSISSFWRHIRRNAEAFTFRALYKGVECEGLKVKRIEVLLARPKLSYGWFIFWIYAFADGKIEEEDIPGRHCYKYWEGCTSTRVPYSWSQVKCFRTFPVHYV